MECEALEVERDRETEQNATLIGSNLSSGEKEGRKLVAGKDLAGDVRMNRRPGNLALALDSTIHHSRKVTL